MIRLLFVVFVCLGGFAALALWNARGGDSRAVVEKVLSGEAAAVVQAEIERLDDNLAALLPENTPIDENAAIEEEGAMDTDDSGSGGNAAVASIEPAAAPSEPRHAEIVPSDSKAKDDAKDSAENGAADDTPPTEVHDVVPPAEFAQDLGAADDLAEAGDPAPSDDPTAIETRYTEASLAEEESSADSADLIRRMLAVYSRTNERR